MTTALAGCATCNGNEELCQHDTVCPPSPFMRLEVRPTVLYAAQYKTLPFPPLSAMQEVAFDLGITALARPLTVSGVVFELYNDHQQLLEERWPARLLRERLQSDSLAIEPGTGLALRSLHFMLHALEPLTHVDVTVVGRVEGEAEAVQAQIRVGVRYHEQKSELHCPVRGAWWAIQAADWSDRHKQEVFSQPFALDLVKLGEESRFFRGSGLAVEEHYSWDQPVYAPAGGKVAYVCYDMPDLAPGQTADPRMFRGDPRRYLGNGIAISHGNGEFSFFGCLQQASMAVNEGAMIRRGALLARVGNSGLTPGPHLHYHLMEGGPNPFLDQGVPFQWSHFSAGGQFFAQPVTIPTRMIVSGPVPEPAG